MKYLYPIFLTLYFLFGNNQVFATQGIGGSRLGSARANVYTYPSISRHEQRFWNNTRFLYEKSPIKTGAGNLECVYDALGTFPYNLTYYQYDVGSDTKIITNLKNYPKNVGLILLSNRLTQESTLLPSQGYTSPALLLSSLIKKMCPQVYTQTGYNNIYDRTQNIYNKTPKGSLDYVLFQYQP